MNDEGMPSGIDRLCQHRLRGWSCSRCLAIVSANVRADPIKCPKCRGTSIVPLVDPDHGCEDEEAFPSCQASVPLMEDRFACPKCGTRQMRLRFAGRWD